MFKKISFISTAAILTLILGCSKEAPKNTSIKQAKKSNTLKTAKSENIFANALYLQTQLKAVNSKMNLATRQLYAKKNFLAAQRTMLRRKNTEKYIKRSQATIKRHNKYMKSCIKNINSYQKRLKNVIAKNKDAVDNYTKTIKSFENQLNTRKQIIAENQELISLANLPAEEKNKKLTNINKQLVVVDSTISSTQKPFKLEIAKTLDSIGKYNTKKILYTDKMKEFFKIPGNSFSQIASLDSYSNFKYGSTTCSWKDAQGATLAWTQIKIVAAPKIQKVNNNMLDGKYYISSINSRWGKIQAGNFSITFRINPKKIKDKPSIKNMLKSCIDLDKLAKVKVN